MAGFLDLDAILNAWPGPAATSAAVAAIGVMCVMLAWRRLGWRLRLPATLRGRLLLGMTVVGLVPVLSLALVVGQHTADQRTARRASQAHERSVALARDIDELLAKHRAAITTLASSMGASATLDAGSAARWLAEYHGLYSDFVTMFVADRAAQVLSSTVRLDGVPVAYASPMSDLRNREYFQEPMRTGKPFVSNLSHGHILGGDTIISMSASFAGADGSRAGVVQGALDLTAFERLVAPHVIQPGTDVVILDANRRVVYATAGSGVTALETVPADSWLATIREARTDAPTTRNTTFVSMRQIAASGWEVAMRRSLAEVKSDRATELRYALSWSLAALLIAVGLALLVSASIGGPLAWLGDAMRTFDPTVNARPAAAPAGAPREIVLVVERLGELGQRLHTAYAQHQSALHHAEQLRGELTRVLDGQDEEIRERTAQLEQANAALQQLTRVDSLTGLANRRWFAEFLEQAWRVGLREQIPIAMIIADIDHFKAYNDHYGHQAGDDCLLAVAEAIQRAVSRPLDLVARYGGEEFVLVLADTPLEAGRMIGERVRAAVQAIAIPHAGSSTGVVTLSVGVAATVPARGTQPSTFMVAADRALYQAKAAGRNRVAVAEGMDVASRRPVAIVHAVALPEA